MALIGKIRNNSWILIVMIAVGMGGFILQSVVSDQNKRTASNYDLATINGKTIDYREFQNTENVLYSGAKNQDAYAQKASLWQYFMDKAIVESEAEQLGIGVSTEELLELQFGEKLSPIITARFKNQSGQIDRERLNSFRQAIEANELDVQFKEYWAVQEKEIIKERQQSKLQNLFIKAVYTPKWMAEEISKESSSIADFEFVKISFDNIVEGDVELTDDAINKYLQDNKNKYINLEESRMLNFVEFTVFPTAADSVKNESELTEIVEDFQKATNDSLFVLNNSGNYTFVYYKPEDLPEQVKTEVEQMEVSQVIGPYFDVDKYTIAKLVDKKMVPDSVKARHILQAINPQDQASFGVAQQMIDSIKTVLESGLASFDSLAIKHSQDPGSASKGGDLGYFAQGTMVPPFNHACFHGKKGDYQVVYTQFGVHLIEVLDQKFLDNNPKYKVAYISNAIVPSQQTQDSLYDVATELVTSSEGMDAFIENVNNELNIELKESSPFMENDYNFMTYGSDPASRDIIRWGFEPGVEVGDISPVIYTYTDKINYYNSNYLVIALKRVNPEGLRTVEDIRSTVEPLVLNQLKGAKIIERISGSDLSSIATQFNTKVDTLSAVAFNSSFIPSLGNEPQVLNLVFNGELNVVQGPIMGNSGVFMVKPLIVNISDQASPNFLQQKSTSESQVKNEASYKFLDALRKNADMEDNRSLFF